MKNSSYERMDDHGVGDTHSQAVTAVAVGKFCSFGFVVSNTWFSCFIVIVDGVMKVYDSAESYHNNPQNHVLLLSLSKNHRASEIKRKNYSEDSRKIVEFYCFYVEVENGLFSPTRQFKLGFMNRNTAEWISRAINLNSKGVL